jgi:hypothetical protein
MTAKHEKNGLDLFIITPAMLQGLDTLAAQFKKAHDEHNYNFLTTIKTALSKYAVISTHVNEMASLERAVAAALKKSADFEEQLFPIIRKTKSQAKSFEEQK